MTLVWIAIGAALGATLVGLAFRAQLILTKAQADRAEQLQRELHERDARIHELQRERDTRVFQIQKENEAKLAELHRQHDAKLGELHRETDSRLDGLQREHAATLAAGQRDHESRLDTLQRQLADARVEATALRERLDSERAAGAEKLALLDDAQKKLGDAFRALSADALDRNNQNFLDLAKNALLQQQELSRTDLDAKSKEIDQLVKPLKESLEKVDSRIGELEKARAVAYGTLAEQVRSLSQTQQSLQAETQNLVRALRAPQVRGRWGEIQLRRVVEMAGMLAHCDFDEQPSVDHEDGRMRPDMIVRLPNGRCIVVDSKAPLQAYLEAVETQDDSARTELLRQHAAQIRAHIRKLSEKSYWDRLAATDATPEFVVLFLPGESFYSAALELDPGLIEGAIEQRVILATPTTLIALLRAISYGWRQETITREALQISALGKELYTRVRTMASHFADMRKSLDRTVLSYNRAVSSLESRVLPSARRFRELGAVADDEAIDQLEAVDQHPRSLQAADMQEPGPTPRAVQTEL
jgi:DNA recombination protein RmuC